MVDDISSLYYRTHGGQITPLIIRTRGHRLEGIWAFWFSHGNVVKWNKRNVFMCPERYDKSFCWFL